MPATLPEDRQRAPADAGVLQEFLNSAQLGGAPGVNSVLAAEVFARHAAGESQASIAATTGLARTLVSAIARGVQVVDALDSPESATKWFEEKAPDFAGRKVTSGELVRLQSLREALRELALANAGVEIEPGAYETLNAIALAERPALRFAPHAAKLAPESICGWLLVVAFDAMRDGIWERVKRCTGDGCPHVFYDASKNRSGAWCAMAVCGNRRKVRAYQQRRRAGKQA